MRPTSIINLLTLRAPTVEYTTVENDIERGSNTRGSSYLGLAMRAVKNTGAAIATAAGRLMTWTLKNKAAASVLTLGALATYVGTYRAGLAAGQALQSSELPAVAPIPAPVPDKCNEIFVLQFGANAGTRMSLKDIQDDSFLMQLGPQDLFEDTNVNLVVKDLCVNDTHLDSPLEFECNNATITVKAQSLTELNSLANACLPKEGVTKTLTKMINEGRTEEKKLKSGEMLLCLKADQKLAHKVFASVSLYSDGGDELSLTGKLKSGDSGCIVKHLKDDDVLLQIYDNYAEVREIPIIKMAAQIREDAKEYGSPRKVCYGMKSYFSDVLPDGEC